MERVAKVVGSVYACLKGAAAAVVGNEGSSQAKSRSAPFITSAWSSSSRAAALLLVTEVRLGG